MQPPIFVLIGEEILEGKKHQVPFIGALSKSFINVYVRDV